MTQDNRTNRLLTGQNHTAEEPAKKGDKAPLKHWQKELLDWGKSILLALLAFVLIRTFLFTMIRVDGQSMLDTLQNGDRLFVSVLDVKLKGIDALQDEDIIICHYPGRGKQDFVKRVIARGGDTVLIENGITYVNGEMREESFLTRRSFTNFGPYTVPEGTVFVMGDNRPNSSDSRHVGPLDESMLVGKVRFRWWPLSAFGPVGN